MIIVPTEKRFDWNNAPIALFVIVILNVLVFYAYQTGDNDHFETAINTYVDEGLYQLEAPLYLEYLKQNQATEELDLFTQLQQHPNKMFGAALILQNEEFYLYLQTNGPELFDPYDHDFWQYKRQEIQELMYSVSYQKHGLVANDIKITALISHQFLHGGTMHLIGNMFFLIICGFAVEAAVGHKKFLIFYLVSGVGAGLAQVLIDLDSSTPLVGASGAVSGVMAMYLGIFRLKKIEFFYWFFVFVGYFRAPALFILPFYIGAELFSMWTQPDSNVAFMAHVGGFVTGAILIAATLWLKPEELNHAYIEEEQIANPEQISLEKLYQQLEKFQFATALKSLNNHSKQFGADFNLQFIKYNLLLHLDPIKAQLQRQKLIAWPKPDTNELNKIEVIWQSIPNTDDPLDQESQYRLAWNFITSTEHIKHAVKIFNDMYAAESKHPTLNLLAKKIAFTYRGLENRIESERYLKIAQELS